jgi:two-component system OmpR family sensor kinase
MMARRLGWIGLGFFGGGILIAFIVRLTTSSTVLRFEHQIDPAILILILALLTALIFFSLSTIFRRQASRTKSALVEQANSLEEERRRFIRRLDHELKNPLTAIQIQLDNLQESQTGNPPAIEDVRTQANRLALLTRGLRRLADLETRPLEMEPVVVEELLNEVVELLQAPDRIQLDIQRLPWPIPPIEGDRELLLLAFRNLAANALSYSDETVQIRARHTSGHLVVEVIDTGRGIPPDELPLVTEELYRGSNVHEVPGSGLGLSIVQRVLVRHGGSLELRSRSGQGTIATLQLPYEQIEIR